MHFGIIATSVEADDFIEIAEGYICTFALKASPDRETILEFLGNRLADTASGDTMFRGRLKDDFERLIKLQSLSDQRSMIVAMGHVMMVLLPFAKDTDLSLAEQVAIRAYQCLPAATKEKAAADKAIENVRSLLKSKSSATLGQSNRGTSLAQLAKWIRTHRRPDRPAGNSEIKGPT